MSFTDVPSAIMANRSQMCSELSQAFTTPTGALIVTLTPDYVSGVYRVEYREDSEHGQTILSISSWLDHDRAVERLTDLLEDARLMAYGLSILARSEVI